MNIKAYLTMEDKMSNVFNKIQKAGQQVNNSFKNINEQLDEMNKKS